MLSQGFAGRSGAYEPLVNLGGVLINLHELEEALDVNLRAVLTRPNDPLANSQLGLTYFEVGNYDLALKYLTRTVVWTRRTFRRRN